MDYCLVMNFRHNVPNQQQCSKESIILPLFHCMIILHEEGISPLPQHHFIFIIYSEYNKTEISMEETIKHKGNTIKLNWLGFSSEETI